MKLRRSWVIHPSTGHRSAFYNCGKLRQAFPGTHSTLVRSTLGVNLCARDAAFSWLHVSLQINLTWWPDSQCLDSQLILRRKRPV